MRKKSSSYTVYESVLSELAYYLDLINSYALVVVFDTYSTHIFVSVSHRKAPRWISRQLFAGLLTMFENVFVVPSAFQLKGMGGLVM